MIVQCPECTTKYNLDESKIGHDGTKVRCSRCKNVFTVFRPKPSEEAAPLDVPGAGTSTGPDGDFDDLFTGSPAAKPSRPAVDQSFEDEFAAMFEERPAAPRTRPAAEDSLEDDLAAMLESTMAKAVPKRPVDREMLADLEGAFQQPLIDAPDADRVHDGASFEKSASPRRLGLILGLLVLLLACAGAGIYFFRPALLGLGPEAPAAPAASGSAPREGAAQIALENVRQYFVPNEKEGQLFIIEGKAVNRFPEARELIRLKASLFDSQGGEVASQEFMCGNVVSLYQLQVSSRAEIEAALSAKVGILTNNTNIQPGASVPFMTVFFKAPETVEEFGLEVIQSSLPQQ